MLKNDGFQVSAYFLENPTPPSITVAGVEEIEYDLTFGRGSDSLMFGIEACLAGGAGVGAQRKLDELLAAAGDTSVKEALEADKQLTSRLQDNQTVLTGQTAAADGLRVTRYRGQSPHRLPNGTEVLLASWTVEVLT